MHTYVGKRTHGNGLASANMQIIKFIWLFCSLKINLLVTPSVSSRKNKLNVFFRLQWNMAMVINAIKNAKFNGARFHHRKSNIRKLKWNWNLFAILFSAHISSSTSLLSHTIFIAIFFIYVRCFDVHESAECFTHFLASKCSHYFTHLLMITR